MIGRRRVHPSTVCSAITILALFAVLIGCSQPSEDAPVPPSPIPIEPPPEPPPEPLFVYVAWLPHPDASVYMYRVHYGSGINTVAPVRDVPANVCKTEKCETVFDADRDLLVIEGMKLCFRITAINTDGESPMTPGVCSE